MGDRWTRTVLGALAMWVIVWAGLTLSGVHQPDQLVTLLRFAASDSFIIAAVLRIFRWHSTGDRVQLRHAAGSIGMGLVFPLTSALTSWTTHGAQVGPGGTLTGLLVFLAAAPLIAELRTCRPRIFALGLQGGAIALYAGGSHLGAGIESLAPALVATAATLLLGSAVAEARAAAADADRADELEHALAVVEARLERTRRRQDERLHDARSAVAGVLGVSTMLADTALSSDWSALQRAVAHELERLASVLDTGGEEPVNDFELREALTPTLLLHTRGGARLTWDLPRTMVSGRPRATATALDNVLRNARIHAPGAAISVWCRPQGDAVEVAVDDDGPGIEPGARRIVLERGVRLCGAERPGSGLGLWNVAETMRAQGGDVEISAPAAGGTRVVLSLLCASRLAVSHR